MTVTVCRAEDGHASEVVGGLGEVERLGTLEAVLAKETGVSAENAVAYLPDGRRATGRDVVWDGGGETQTTIYVFNKKYVDMSVEDAMRELEVHAGGIEAPRTTLNQMRDLQRSMEYQTAATETAVMNLSLNVLALDDGWQTISSGMRVELERQAGLMAGVQGALNVLARVPVHPELVLGGSGGGGGAAAAGSGGAREKTLGDYVSRQKMAQVAGVCARVRDELGRRYAHVEGAVRGVRVREEEVRGVVRVRGRKVLEEAEGVVRRAGDAVAKGKGEGRWEETVRQEWRFLVDAKNACTLHVLETLHTISGVNHTLTTIPPLIASLQSAFKPTGKTELASFTHLGRLDAMLYAYGATLVEIVRRKQFKAMFSDRAQAVVDLMTKMAAAERKRRVAYRAEAAGVVPFDVRGLKDVAVEVVDVRLATLGGEQPATGAAGGVEEYAVERADVDAFLRLMRVLEAEREREGRSVRETRERVEKLVERMDAMQDTFDKFTQRALLKGSAVHSRRQSEVVYNEMADQLRGAARDQAIWSEERLSLNAELRRVKEKLAQAEREKASALAERDSAVAERDSAVAERDSERETTTALRTDLDKAREEGSALTAETNALTAKLESVTTENDALCTDLKKARQEASALTTENNTLKATLESVTALRDSLQRDLVSARRDRGQIRDHLVEADGDRAVLQRRYEEVQEELVQSKEELAKAGAELGKTENELAHVQAELAKSENELAKVENELGKTEAELAKVENELGAERAAGDRQHMHTQRLYDELVGQHEELGGRFDALQAGHSDLQTTHQALQTTYEGLQTEYRDLKTEYDALTSTHHALETAHQALEAKHTALQTTHADLIEHSEAQDRNVAQLVHVALAARDAMFRATVQAQGVLAAGQPGGHGGGGRSHGNGNGIGSGGAGGSAGALGMSLIGGGGGSVVLGGGPSPPELPPRVDPTDVAGVVDALRMQVDGPSSAALHTAASPSALSTTALPSGTTAMTAPSALATTTAAATTAAPSADTLPDTLLKISGVLRKWQKQCKEYRERAKGRIVFRNFGKGDLALFLPTRGASAGPPATTAGAAAERPWAAFNVFFPHYFLQPTGALAEQLKTREWIVARITSMTEGVVDSARKNDPNANPYGLGEGVKFYMLQVEDWTQQPQGTTGGGAGGGGGGGGKRRKHGPNASNAYAQPSSGYDAHAASNAHAGPSNAYASSNAYAGPSTLVAAGTGEGEGEGGTRGFTAPEDSAPRERERGRKSVPAQSFPPPPVDGELDGEDMFPSSSGSPPAARLLVGSPPRAGAASMAFGGSPPRVGFGGSPPRAIAFGGSPPRVGGGGVGGGFGGSPPRGVVYGGSPSRLSRLLAQADADADAEVDRETTTREGNTAGGGDEKEEKETTLIVDREENTADVTTEKEEEIQPFTASPVPQVVELPDAAAAAASPPTPSTSANALIGSATPSTSAAPTPSTSANALTAHVPALSSPLRPGSRASASRLSVALGVGGKALGGGKFLTSKALPAKAVVSDTDGVTGRAVEERVTARARTESLSLGAAGAGAGHARRESVGQVSVAGTLASTSSSGSIRPPDIAQVPRRQPSSSSLAPKGSPRRRTASEADVRGDDATAGQSRGAAARSPESTAGSEVVAGSPSTSVQSRDTTAQSSETIAQSPTIPARSPSTTRAAVVRSASASGTLASLASSWGAAFGKRKMREVREGEEE